METVKDPPFRKSLFLVLFGKEPFPSISSILCFRHLKSFCFLFCLLPMIVLPQPALSQDVELLQKIDEIKRQREQEEKLLSEERERVQAVAYSLTRKLCLGYRFIVEQDDDKIDIQRADNPSLYEALLAWSQIFNEGLWASFSTTKQIVHDRRGDHWLDARRWMTSQFLVELINSPQYAQALMDCYPVWKFSNGTYQRKGWDELIEEWNDFTYSLYMFEGLGPLLAWEGIFSVFFTVTAASIRLAARPFKMWAQKLSPPATYWLRMKDRVAKVLSIFSKPSLHQKKAIKNTSLITLGVILGDNLLHYFFIDPMKVKENLRRSQALLIENPDALNDLVKTEPSWRMRILLFSVILENFQKWQTLSTRGQLQSLSETEEQEMKRAYDNWTRLLDKNVVSNYEVYKRHLKEVTEISNPTPQQAEVAILLDTILRLAESRLNYFSAIKSDCQLLENGHGYQCQ